MTCGTWCLIPELEDALGGAADPCVLNMRARSADGHPVAVARNVGCFVDGVGFVHRAGLRLLDAAAEKGAVPSRTRTGGKNPIGGEAVSKS